MFSKKPETLEELLDKLQAKLSFDTDRQDEFIEWLEDRIAIKLDKKETEHYKTDSKKNLYRLIQYNTKLKYLPLGVFYYNLSQPDYLFDKTYLASVVLNKSEWEKVEPLKEEKING